MFLINTAILVAGVLLLLGIASSKFSARLGMPVLVMFLGLGMLAGSEGIGGIAFEDYSLAYAIGTLALALILFDGGLRTPYRSVRAAWKPAGILATAGVFITAVVTGVAASWILQLSLTQGLLLGSIVGSTDAAAVFSILRSGGVHIRRRLADTLEVESGSNDPMAIFMTVGLVEVLSGQIQPGAGLLLMFIVLGLLSFPSRLLDVFMPGMAIAAVLVLVARPLAVALTLFPFRYSIRERLFFSWVGLKGAVPITLATFPLLADLPAASLMFDVVFFVVLVSAVVQGWSLPWVARWLQLEVPPKREPPVTLEISSLFNVEGDIVDYYVDADTPAAGKMVKDLALPEEVVVALIVRNQQTLLPKGSSKIEAGDHVIVVLRPAVRPMVDRVFARREHEVRLTALPTALEFPLKGRIKVRELEQFYDIKLSGNDEQTLDEWIRERAGKKEVNTGFTIPCDQILLCVRGLTNDGHIEFVGMTILPQTVEQPMPSAKATSEAAAEPEKVEQPSPSAKAGVEAAAGPETPPAGSPDAADETARLD
jgi:NhaP-type Na+/H+ and K+/H+ antiporter